MPVWQKGTFWQPDQWCPPLDSGLAGAQTLRQRHWRQTRNFGPSLKPTSVNTPRMLEFRFSTPVELRLSLLLTHSAPGMHERNERTCALCFPPPSYMSHSLSMSGHSPNATTWMQILPILFTKLWLQDSIWTHENLHFFMFLPSNHKYQQLVAPHFSAALQIH